MTDADRKRERLENPSVPTHNIAVERLRRARMHGDEGAIADAEAAWRSRMEIPVRRWYVAHSPEDRRAVIRAKGAPGLADWKGRAWDMFSEPPEIYDVTESMGSVLASMALPDGLRWPHGGVVLLFQPLTAEVLLRSRYDHPPDDGLVDVTETFDQALKDLYGSTWPWDWRHSKESFGTSQRLRHHSKHVYRASDCERATLIATGPSCGGKPGHVLVRPPSPGEMAGHDPS